MPIEAAEPEPVGGRAIEPEAPPSRAREPEIVDGDVLREVETPADHRRRGARDAIRNRPVSDGRLVAVAGERRSLPPPPKHRRRRRSQPGRARPGGRQPPRSVVTRASEPTQGHERGFVFNVVSRQNGSQRSVGNDADGSSRLCTLTPSSRTGRAGGLGAIEERHGALRDVLGVSRRPASRVAPRHRREVRVAHFDRHRAADSSFRASHAAAPRAISSISCRISLMSVRSSE